jgi:hypothetical protein
MLGNIDIKILSINKYSRKNTKIKEENKIKLNLNNGILFKNYLAKSIIKKEYENIEHFWIRLFDLIDVIIEKNKEHSGLTLIIPSLIKILKQNKNVKCLKKIKKKIISILNRISSFKKLGFKNLNQKILMNMIYDSVKFALRDSNQLIIIGKIVCLLNTSFFKCSEKANINQIILFWEYEISLYINKKRKKN